MIRLTTDDKNPHIPQVVMIDGEVMGVIYGGNEVKETDIEIPSYMRDDNVITVTVDRKKGNPNRTTEIALYEYETENTQPANNNQIAFKPQTINSQPSTFDLSINHKLSTIDFRYSIPKAGHINFRIFDAAGRVIETVRSGSVNKGNYSHTPKASKSGVFFAVMEYEGKVYKEKFIILK
ncbi:MAG: T9SS type A sorting domain-containing protein [candidate division WOR-3 bacterium]|nr:T9SS type A sorting domain-containing protein [candidate division WOR-3 bacterium]